MAASSGQPQDTTKTKKAVTPEQRKLYMQLGALGVLALIAAGVWLPGLIAGSGSTPATVTPTTSVTTPVGNVASSPTPPADDGASTPVAVAQAGAPGAGPSVVRIGGAPLARSRPDPFQPLYFIPTPTPIPPPLPTPVPLPPPVPLPSAGGEIAPMIPGVPLPSSASARTRGLQSLNLPPVNIGRLNEATRRPVDAFPPRRTVGAGGGGGGVPTPSFDKRLSGVVIGDGVSAILEIQRPGADGPGGAGGAGVITRIVKPGDEVDGVSILNIQRFNDGTRTVTRMLIRENGEERTVELRAGATATMGGMGGPGGRGGE